MARYTRPAGLSFTAKAYHWTRNNKGKMILHPGLAEKCKRVHYNDAGEKQ